MAEGPDIARIASLIGDAARANMLLAILTGVGVLRTIMMVDGFSGDDRLPEIMEAILRAGETGEAQTIPGMVAQPKELREDEAAMQRHLADTAATLTGHEQYLMQHCRFVPD